MIGNKKIHKKRIYSEKRQFIHIIPSVISFKRVFMPYLYVVIEKNTYGDFLWR